MIVNTLQAQQNLRSRVRLALEDVKNESDPLHFSRLHDDRMHCCGEKQDKAEEGDEMGAYRSGVLLSGTVKLALNCNVYEGVNGIRSGGQG